MSKIETLKQFVEKRLDWNNFLHKKDPKVSDIGSRGKHYRMVIKSELES